MISLPDFGASMRRAHPSARQAVRGRLRATAGFGSNPGALRMWSYAPPALPAKPALVVVLHGCTQTAEGYAVGAGWLQLADVHGFVVLCPEQQAANNPNSCFNWFEMQDIARGSGEVASIRQMIHAALAAHDCDPARVFVTGLSAGGAMSAAMLAAYPEVFAAGGVIAGLPYRAAESVQEALGAMYKGKSQTPAHWGALVRGAGPHGGPWPRVSIWQGDADATVKSSNADALVQQWTDVHGLPAGPTRTALIGRRRQDVWLSAGGEPVVELNTIAGLGHGAPLAASSPGGVGKAGPFLLEAGVSSSLELLRFWGLAAEAPASEAAEPSPPPPPRHSARSGVHDIQGVITRALTAAGLIK